MSRALGHAAARDVVARSSRISRSIPIAHRSAEHRIPTARASTPKDGRSAQIGQRDLLGCGDPKDLRICWIASRRGSAAGRCNARRHRAGRSFAGLARIFLMDEPLTNLDAKLRETLRVELIMLRRELKTPMIYVTHDQAEALSMGDRIVVLGGGRILQTGTPQRDFTAIGRFHPNVARQLGQAGDQPDSRCKAGRLNLG